MKIRLILKARAGLVAKKISVTRGGKTFQQTVYVRAGEKKPKQKKMNEAQRAYRERTTPYYPSFMRGAIAAEKHGGDMKIVRRKDRHSNKYNVYIEYAGKNGGGGFAHYKDVEDAKYEIDMARKRYGGKHKEVKVVTKKIGEA